MQRYDARVDQDMIPYHEETADGDWVKYDAARAEIERLRLELEAEKRSFQRRAAELWQPIYDKARAEIERLNSALADAACQISDLAARLGRAEGKLDASELVGVVEGWRERALKAEAALEAYGREKVREGMRRAATICDSYCSEYLEPAADWQPDYVSAWETGGLDHLLAARDAILVEMEKLK